MKTVFKNIKLQHLVLALTALYMGIETQSLLMVWDITNHAPSADVMEKYERFGYAASGLGITLLAARFLLKTKLHALAVLAIIPLIYLASVWSVYEAVSRAPELIPEESKPKALASSLAIITRPETTSMFSFYTGQDVDRTGLATDFNIAHPMPNQVIQATYLNGVNSVSLITHLFQNNWHRLDKQQFTLSMSKGDLVLGRESIKANAADGALREVNTAKQIMTIAEPLNYLILLNPEYIRSVLERHDASYIQSRQVIAVTYDLLTTGFNREGGLEQRVVVRSNYEKYYLSSNTDALSHSNQKYWDKLRDKLTFLEAKAPPLSDREIDWDFAIREQYTNNVLAKHIGGAKIPTLDWYNPRVSYVNNETFLAILNHATPFFFDENGAPLLDFKDLVKPGVAGKMRGSLSRGLNDSLHAHYDRYRETSLDGLMTSQDEWKNFTNNATFSPLLRIGVILPALFVLSVALLVANATSLSKASWVALGAGLTASAIVVLIQDTPASEALTDIILNISVQKHSFKLT